MLIDFMTSPSGGLRGLTDRWAGYLDHGVEPLRTHPQAVAALDALLLVDNVHSFGLAQDRLGRALLPTELAPGTELGLDAVVQELRAGEGRALLEADVRLELVAEVLDRSSMSPSSPPPFTMLFRMRSICRKPSRQGTHWPQDSWARKST
jgi:hypothetical protein